jgi:hypothetical protein
MQGNLRGAMLQSSSFLTMFGTVVLGLHSLWQARVAQQIVDGGNAGSEDASFYKGKILNAKFYMKNILPKATALGKAIQNSDESCLEDGLFD